MTSTLDFAGFRPVVVAPRATFAAKGKPQKAHFSPTPGHPAGRKNKPYAVFELK